MVWTAMRGPSAVNPSKEGKIAVSKIFRKKIIKITENKNKIKKWETTEVDERAGSIKQTCQHNTYIA